MKKNEGYSSLPAFPLRDELSWLGDVSVWSAPPSIRLADIRDGFLLGGGGHCSARLGTRERVSTMDRVMAPYLSSYNFAENNNFRMDAVTPSRDFYPPFTFTPLQHHVWRVRNSGIVITAERDESYELVTVSAVHPIRHAFLRYASLRNISNKPITDIGLRFEAIPDIPFPIAGHRSLALPLNADEIIERVQEMKPAERDYGPKYLEETQRFRFMVRGLIEGKTRGYQDLFIHWDELAPDEVKSAVHYLVPGLRDTEASAIESAQLIRHELEATSIEHLFQEIHDWWDERSRERTQFAGSDGRFVELLENNAVLQTSVEGVTGGFVVIDDYTGSWLRDHNGSHLLSLDLGLHETVCKSMDRYYGLDVTNRSLYSVYASDSEPVSPLPQEPDWESVDGFVTGDVPNFRTLWYVWYFKHTGDLNLVRERFNYMKGAFMRQKLHERGYLAEYCFDETYGIGPVGPMRRGLSADNSFIALAAAHALAYFAKLLGRNDAKHLSDYRDSIQKAIEQTFWLEDEGYYAMRLTPEGTLDKTPLSIGLLRPLWTGASGEDDHAIRSVLYTLKHLYHKNGFLRLIPAHDQTVTMAIGYLLFAIKKIGHPGIDRVFNDVLKWANPSGTFGEYLDERKDGPWQCYEHMAHRNRMWESGINADAVIYTLTGFSPNAFERRVSFAPYLPNGWTHFNAERFRVADAHISLLQSKAHGKNRVVVRQDSGEPLNVEVVLTAESAKKVRVAGKGTNTNWQENRFGLYRTKFDRQIQVGEEIEIIY